MFERDGGRCFYCRQPVDLSSMTLDHFVPRSCAGSNNRTNCVAACEPCNTAKDNFDPRVLGLLSFHGESAGDELEAFRMEVAASAMRNMTYRNYQRSRPAFHHQRIFIE